MKAFILTLGCKVNQYESQAMLDQLVHAGFSQGESMADSDVIVINSCTVTAVSDQKVRQTLHRARRQSPNAVIVLTGCMPQAFPELAEKLTEADVVLGNSNRASLVPDLLRFLSSRQRVIDLVPHQKGEGFASMKVDAFPGRTRAFVKIEDGCNRYCAYCIIPTARGSIRSKPLEALQEELLSLSENGYSEIVLTGINLSAYGQELGLHLCDAIEAACLLPKVQRVRLGSLEPEQLSPNVVKRLSKQKKLCPQFHLSLQSGCDQTLKRMNRHYTTQEYDAIVQSLRSAFENAAITTDLMVGFPGETEQEFSASLAFAKKIGFARTHVFAYSRRPGTKADAMPDQVTHAEKEMRSKQMLRQAQESQQAFFESQLGKTAPVLFERACEQGVYEGYTPNYTPVRVASGQSLSGKLLNVRLTQALREFCMGALPEE